VDFWYLLISLKATVPGLNLWTFLTPAETAADFFAAFYPIGVFLGTLPAVVACFLAVNLVLAILIKFLRFNRYKLSIINLSVDWIELMHLF